MCGLFACSICARDTQCACDKKPTILTAHSCRASFEKNAKQTSPDAFFSKKKSDNVGIRTHRMTNSPGAASSPPPPKRAGAAPGGDADASRRAGADHNTRSAPWMHLHRAPRTLPSCTKRAGSRAPSAAAKRIHCDWTKTQTHAHMQEAKTHPRLLLHFFSLLHVSRFSTSHVHVPRTRPTSTSTYTSTSHVHVHVPRTRPTSTSYVHVHVPRTRTRPTYTSHVPRPPRPRQIPLKTPGLILN